MALNVQPLLLFSLGLQADNIQRGCARRLCSGTISQREEKETLKINAHIQRVSFQPQWDAGWRPEPPQSVLICSLINTCALKFPREKKITAAAAAAAVI